MTDRDRHTTDLIPGVGDRFLECIATDEYLRGEVWGFVLLEVTGDIDGIRAAGRIGARAATRVEVVAIARRDHDSGDEDRRPAFNHLCPRRRSEGAGFDLCRWGERGDCDNMVKDGGNYCPAHRAAAGHDGPGS